MTDLEKIEAQAIINKLLEQRGQALDEVVKLTGALAVLEQRIKGVAAVVSSANG